jgi:hypothetical protein
MPLLVVLSAASLANGPRVVHAAGTVAHLMNVLSGTVLFYAAVTRGGLLFARVLQRLAKSS